MNNFKQEMEKYGIKVRFIESLKPRTCKVVRVIRKDVKSEQKEAESHESKQSERKF